MFQVREFVFFLVTIFEVVLVKGDPTYNAAFMENMESCPDFENKFINALPLLMASEGLGLEGSIETMDDLPEKSKVILEIYKETDHGLEYMCQMVSGLCESLEDENAPWRPVVEAMNLSGCPIPVKIFEIKKLIIELAFANDFLCHEYVGGYIIKFIIMDNSNPPEMIVCYQVQVAIVEVEE